MYTKQINDLRVLAGLPIVEAAEATVAGDVTSSVQYVSTPEKEVPANVSKALKDAIKCNADCAEDQGDQGSTQDQRFYNTLATFLSELDAMLDGTEEGFKRAGEHLHSAMNPIVDRVPDVVVKYLSGNASADLNKEDINKQGIRKHLRSYVEDRRS